MKFRTLLRHFRDAFRSLWRNGWMTFASISTVTISLFILGVFVLLNLNLESWTNRMERQVEIRAFLQMEASDAQVLRLGDRLRQIPEVEEVVFIPREQGLEELKAGFGDQGYLLEGLEEDNPLPHAYLIKTKDPQLTPEIAKQIESFDIVEKVRYGSGIVEQLFKVTNTIRNVGLVLIVGLAFTAMFLIANTIKLTILSRKNEIEIMKLVGATNGYIRWPFFIEGSLLGLVGAIIPLGILLGGYSYLINHFQTSIIFTFLPMESVWGTLTTMLLGIGVFIGIWGSITSIRKFLRV